MVVSDVKCVSEAKEKKEGVTQTITKQLDCVCGRVCLAGADREEMKKCQERLEKR